MARSFLALVLLLTVSCSSTSKSDTRVLRKAPGITFLKFLDPHLVQASPPEKKLGYVINPLQGTISWHGVLYVREGEVWEVPDYGKSDDVALNLHKMWAHEVEWDPKLDDDMIGIWQVVRNIRARHCNRDKAPRITECRNGQETRLSAMRRLSKRVTGMMPPLSPRTVWVRNLKGDCSEPEGWPQTRSWQNMVRWCRRSIKRARQVVSGRVRANAVPGVPIAWGGRCESKVGACDDWMACRRRLARIPTRTSNAFWCRPGTRGCSDKIDPICSRF